MKHSSILVSVIAALAFMATACKSQYDIVLESNDVDLKYQAAFDYFNKAKFIRAATLFESLSLLTGGSDRADTVQYYWGLSNYNNRDYYTAETNFEQFLENYPLSPFADNAEFLHIDCLYRATYRYELDQAPTYKAMTAISEYILKHPVGANADICRHMLEDLNERLDKKAFEAARLYYKMEDYKASRVAFKNIIKDDPENCYREDVLYYTAMSSYKYAQLSIPSKRKERYLVFMDDYFNFIEEYPEASRRKELEGLYRKVKENY